MRIYLFVAIATLLTVLALACNQTGLSGTPRATFSQLACLDTNGDGALNAADAADESKVPDFNGDGKRNGDDAAFLRGVDIPLAPGASDGCKNGSGRAPEYLVAHGYFKPAEVKCDAKKQPVLLIGIGGGVVNLKDREDAAGVRSMIDSLQKAYKDQDTQTIAILAGPAMVGAQNLHGGMELWLTHAVSVYLDRYPCLRVVLLGHSHGAVTADVVAARLEGNYAARFIEVVDVDRVTALYTGDTQSRPRQVHVFNIYETNDPGLSGAPYDSPNAENVDASDQQAPENGDKGGPLKPVNHTTIDNSKSVKDLIVQQVMKISQ